MKFKHVLVISLIFIILSCLKAEDYKLMDHLKFYKQVLLNDELQINSLSKIKLFDDKLYIMQSSKRPLGLNDSVNIYICDDSVQLIYSIKPNLQDVLLDFDIDSSSLFLLFQFSLVKYNIVEGEIINSIIIRTNDIFQNLSINNNNLFLYNTCSTCMKPGMRLTIIDKEFNNKAFKSFDNPIGFQTNYFKPNRHISCDNSKILKSEIIDYNIKILDESLATIYSLKRENSVFCNSSEFINILNKNSDEFWLKNISKYDSLNRIIGRIINVDFINKYSILVCYTIAGLELNDSDKYRYDIWVYNQTTNQWQLNKKDLFFKKDFCITKIEHLCGGIGINYIVDDGYIIVPKYFPFDYHRMIEEKRTVSEVNTLIQEYYRTHRLNYSSIFIFKLKD